MSIEVTGDALEVLKRSLQLGRVDPEKGGIRLRATRGLTGGFTVQVELAEGPLEGEETLRNEGLNIFIGTDITEAMPDAVVGVEPEHERIVVRPASRGGGS